MLTILLVCSNSTLREWCSPPSVAVAPERSVAIKPSPNGSSTSSTESDAGWAASRTSVRRHSIRIRVGCHDAEVYIGAPPRVAAARALLPTVRDVVELPGEGGRLLVRQAQ